MKDDPQPLFDKIHHKLKSLPEGSCDHQEFLAHIRSLAQWHEEPMDYLQDHHVEFPESLDIASAVCHPGCGTSELIVDGSTQECQRCGVTMFRTETAEYRLVKTLDPSITKK